MVRVDEVEVVQQLPRQRIARAVHDVDAEAVRRTGRRNLEGGHRRLGEHVMRRIRRQIHRRELDHQIVALAIEENARGAGVGDPVGTGRVHHAH